MDLYVLGFGEVDSPECTTWGCAEKTKDPSMNGRVLLGVANAARTRDLLNHNQMLYQLSYGHHGV